MTRSARTPSRWPLRCRQRTRPSSRCPTSPRPSGTAPTCLSALDGRALGTVVAEAGELLATVLGQDLDQTDGQDGQPGVFRIARRVGKDRIISTVDPQARHGRKTSARGFDGYKGHVAVDPDSEIVTDTVVRAGNVGTGSQDEPEPAVYGDSAYGSSGEFLDALAEAGIESKCETQPPTAAGGLAGRRGRRPWSAAHSERGRRLSHRRRRTGSALRRSP